MLTDEAGRYEAKIPSGRYQITAAYPGYVAMEYGQREAFEPSAALDLSANERLNVNFELPLAGSVHGRVVDETSMPLGRAEIRVWRVIRLANRHVVADGPPTFSATNDDDGRFEIAGLAPGDYIVQAALRGGFGGSGTDGRTLAYQPTFAPAATDRSQAQIVHLNAGERRSVGIVLVPAPVDHVKGTVRDMSDGAAGIARLYRLDGGPREQVGIGQIAADGSFDIEVLRSAARYLITTVLKQREPSANATVRYGRVEIDAATNNEVAIDSVPGSDVAGRVEPMDSSERAPLRIEAVPLFEAPAGGNAATVRVEQDGTFRLRNLDSHGPWTFAVVGSETLGSRIEYRGHDVTDHGLWFKPGETIEGLRVVRSRDSHHIDGRLRRTAKWVIAIGDGPRSRSERARTTRVVPANADGSFGMDVWPEESYCLAAVRRMDRALIESSAVADLFCRSALRVDIKDQEKITTPIPVIDADP